MFPEFSMWNIKVSTVNIFWLGIYKKALCSQCCEVWGVTGNWISAQGLEELVEHLSIWYNNLDICHFSPQTTHLGQFCHQKYIDKIICLHLIWIVSMTDLSPRTLSTASVTDISCANNNGWQYMNLLWCHSALQCIQFWYNRECIGKLSFLKTHTSNIKHCQRHNGPRVLSLWLELSCWPNWICNHFR